MKILVIALSGIGDAVMFTPALRILKQHYPTAEIDIVTMFRGVAEMYERLPDVSSVYLWDFLKKGKLDSLKFLGQLRSKKYDVSILVFPSNRWQYNVIAWMIGAKKRLGTDYLNLNAQSLPFLLTDRIQENDDLHNVEENCKLVELLGVKIPQEIPPLQLVITPADDSTTDSWLREHNIPTDKPIIGIHAGSAVFKNQINKRWAWEKYAELSVQLHEKYDATILLFGGPEELELNENIALKADGSALVVKTPSIMSSIALMKRCSLFVSNDSGLMHIAAALQLHVVSVFGYTSHIHTRPWTPNYEVVRHDLECSPCFYFSPRPAQCQFSGEDEFKCIRRIEVEEVLKACERLMLRE
ncbi:MAG: lipopolysaccharide heptosyltransferase II [Ignavibacteria bacterium]|nr:lipopolysaccharide heptosyltransferase II [Ignavibacteria bacterium]